MRPPVLVSLLLCAFAAVAWTGCAGAASGRSSAKLVLPGATGCTDPATAPSPATPPVAGSRQLLVGLNAALRYFGGEGLCQATRAVRDNGGRVVREDFLWPAIEPRRGAYDWTIPDRLATTAARWGLVLLPILGNVTPNWARGTRSRSYGRFVAAVVTRYGPNGTFVRRHPGLAPAAPRWFELWNEPYVRANPNRLSVAAYAALVHAAVAAGRSAAPGVRFLVAAAGSYTREDRSTGNWIRELNALAPLAQNADGASVHAYGVAPPAPFDATSPSDQVSSVEGVHDDLVALGVGRLPIWVTESGWSTCRNRTVCVDEQAQARDLDRLFTYARTRWRDYVRALVVYSLQDTPSARYGDKEGFFGLYRVDGTAKPAQAVFKRRAGR